MKKLLFISSLVVSSLISMSCSKGLLDNNAPIVKPVDLYVGGSKDGKPCYWKNGEIVVLNLGQFSKAFVQKIIFSNGNVYAFGKGTFNKDAGYPLLWKNGVLTDLKTQLNKENDTSSSILSVNDIDVVGDDVYFVGTIGKSKTEKYLAYWKNGIETRIQETIANNNGGLIKVFNNNVYTYFDYSSSGYFINREFKEINIANITGFSIGNNKIYAYGRNSLLKGFYYDIVNKESTEVSFPTDETVRHFSLDKNNIYYGNNEYIYKNGKIFFDSSKEPGSIYTSQVYNDNLYKIHTINTSEVNFSQTIYINDTISLKTSSPTDSFYCLFLVQN